MSPQGKGHDESSLQTNFLNPTTQSGNHQGGVSAPDFPALTATYTGSDPAGTSNSYGGLGNRPGRTMSPAFLKGIYIGSIFLFISGVACGNLGGWHESVVGFLGMCLITVGVVTSLFVAYQRFHQRSSAGAARANITMRPTVNLRQGVVSPSQDGGTTSYVIETRGMQTEGVPIGSHGFNTQCGYSQGPMQNVPGTAYQPPTNIPDGYPQPISTDPMGTPMPCPSPGATPQFNYPVMHPPQITRTHFGVTHPVSEENDLPPPPSYQDVFSKSY